MAQSEKRARIIAGIVDRTCINDVMINWLVQTFYGEIRKGALLGPVFDARITDWEAHLKRMSAFWASVVLMSGRYHG